MADPSSSIIGDFLVFDNHLITDKAVYRTSPMKRVLPELFVDRVTHDDRHAMQPAIVRVKYDDRQQYTKLCRERNANGKTDEMCPVNVRNLSTLFFCGIDIIVSDIITYLLSKTACHILIRTIRNLLFQCEQ